MSYYSDVSTNHGSSEYYAHIQLPDSLSGFLEGSDSIDRVSRRYARLVFDMASEPQNVAKYSIVSGLKCL